MNNKIKHTKNKRNKRHICYNKYARNVAFVYSSFDLWQFDCRLINLSNNFSSYKRFKFANALYVYERSG